MSKRKRLDANADFKAIRMIDGKPMEFGYTNAEFANDFCTSTSRSRCLERTATA